MKKLLLFSFIVFGLLSIRAQEISNQQWSMITKTTSDDCVACGDWGWDFKDILLEDYSADPVVFWMAHFEGGLQTNTATAIANNFQSTGLPSFYINTDDLTVSSANVDEKRDEFQIIVQALNSFEPLAGVGSESFYDGEKITVTTRVQYFAELEGGDYWLASYLVDNVLLWEQAGQNGEVEHDNILLHSLNGDDHFGINISSGQVVSNGAEFTTEGEIALETDDINGYSIVTVLWSFVDGQYVPINMNEQSIEILSSTENVLQNLSLKAFRSSRDLLSINLLSDVNVGTSTISLYDINGKLIASKDAVISEGSNDISLLSPSLSTGTYIVNVNSGKGNRSIKIGIR